MRMRVWCSWLMVALMSVAISGEAWALGGSTASSIIGTVSDASGAVIPGATVVVKSNSTGTEFNATTNEQGGFTIPAVDPGTYTVTFTLPGFSTIKREGIELQGTFVATINVEMRVGTLEETITVTGETPIVDVQSARRGQVLTDEAFQRMIELGTRFEQGVQRVIDDRGLPFHVTRLIALGHLAHGRNLHETRAPGRAEKHPARASSLVGQTSDLFFDQRLGQRWDDFPYGLLDHFTRKREHALHLILRETELR